jgi:regulator of protease activity HflC (stomatin/prohibitin superfamily)
MAGAFSRRRSVVLWIVVMVLLTVVGLVASRAPAGGAPALAVVVAVAVLFTGARSVKVVAAGEVAVVRTFGDITGQRGEGLSLIAPWETVDRESIRVQNARFENVSAFSAETQDVFATIEINYRVEDRAVQGLLRDVGTNWFDVLIEGRVQNFFKEETVKFKTDQVAPNREAIRAATQQRLSAALEPFSIEVTELLIVNVSFSQAYVQSIENKQIATQEALQAQEEVATTRAEADKERERARGTADAAVIEAEGVNEANRLIAESLTPEVLQYLAINEFNDNVTIALVPSGEGLLLDPSTLIGSGADAPPTVPTVPSSPPVAPESDETP